MASGKAGLHPQPRELDPIQEQENCFMRNNPWAKVGTVFTDATIIFYYRLALSLGTALTIMCLFGFALPQIAGYFNFPGLLHVIPVLLPSCCSKGLPPTFWAFISLASIVGSIVSFVLGIINSTALASFIFNLVFVGGEVLMLYFMQRIDPGLREKVLACFNNCRCCMTPAQIEEQRSAELARKTLAEEAGVAEPKAAFTVLPVATRAVTGAKPTPSGYRTPFATGASDIESQKGAGNYRTPFATGMSDLASVATEFDDDNQGRGSTASRMVKPKPPPPPPGIGESVLSAISNFNVALAATKEVARAAERGQQDVENVHSSIQQGPSAAANYQAKMDEVARQERLRSERAMSTDDVDFEGVNDGGKRVILKKENPKFLNFKHKDEL